VILSPSQTLSEALRETLAVFPKQPPDLPRLSGWNGSCYDQQHLMVEPSKGQASAKLSTPHLRSMPILSIDDIKPGMMLAEAVRNHQDHLLLEAGRRITEKSLRVFKSWGIRRVAIKLEPGVDDSGDGAVSPRLPPAIDEGFKERFADAVTDPLMAAIMQAAARQLAARPPKKKSGYGRR
jgi:hypothetical protein